MFPANAKINELIALLDYLAPVSQNAGTYNTPNWIYVGNLGDQLQALFVVGAMAGSSTLNGSIQQATSSGGANAKAVTGKSLTQVQQAASGANTINTIDFRCQDLDTNNGFDYVQVQAIVGTAACMVGIVLLATGRYEAVNASGASLNAAAVLQQV